MTASSEVGTARANQLVDALSQKLADCELPADARKAIREWREEIRKTEEHDIVALAERMALCMQLVDKIHAGEKGAVIMNQYNNSGITGNMGDGGQVVNSTFIQGTGGQMLVGGQFDQLGKELDALYKAMKSEQDVSQREHDRAIAAVLDAKEAADAKDEAGVMASLKKVGKWGLDIAEKIAVGLTVKVILATAGA
ncbi:MAG TPA: hypothetical protein VK176_13045 [Phycisphaerales bacterium]|nr:hypothetical protein [Phycisphaerales bacterium]